MKRANMKTMVMMVLAAFLAGAAGAQEGDVEAGKKMYAALCASCHGNGGKGDGPAAQALPVKPRDHTNGEYMNTLTNEYLTNFIKDGGAAVGKSPLMPGFGGQLKDQDVRNLVAYIRSLAQPPYEASK